MSPAFASESEISETTIQPTLTHSPFRVVLASSQADWGGGETYLADLADELRRRGAGVEFLAREGSALHKHVSNSGFSVQTIRGRGKSPATIWKLRRWLRRGGPTVLHCNDSHALLCAGLAAVGLKSASVVAMKHTMFPIRSALKYKKLAQRVICVSHAVADMCRERGIPAENLRTIHSAIKAPQVDSADVARIRSQLLPTDEHRLIVAIGNLVPCKGHHTLVEAAAILKTMGIKARTVIAGDGSERKSLEAKIKNLGLTDCVRLLGFRYDAETLTAAADVIAHPAHEEGLGLSVAAALMLERPVVATAVGGLSEVLGIDPRMEAAGPFATVIKPGDSQQLAKMLARQLTTPTNNDLLRQARDYALDRFGSTRMASATQAVFNELWEEDYPSRLDTETTISIDSASLQSAGDRQSGLKNAS